MNRWVDGLKRRDGWKGRLTDKWFEDGVAEQGKDGQMDGYKPECLSRWLSE